MDFGIFHVVTLLCTALVILYSDHQGFLYFRGKKQLLPKSFIEWSHRIIWVGLILMIVSGVLLTIPVWEYRLTEFVFYIKMGFVLVLIMNAFAIGSLARVASEQPFASLSVDEKRTLFVSGGLSLCGWVGAVIIGIFFL